MGAFGVIIGILHYMGLYLQLSTAFKPIEHDEVDNRISGNGMISFYSRLVVIVNHCSDLK